MASKLVRASVLRPVASRQFAAQPAAAAQSLDPSAGLTREPLKTSTLASGLQVASVENQAPLSRVAIAVRAGSRYEATGNRGAAHVLRVCAGLATAEFSAFGLTRRLQQMGASLACSGDRELLVYSVDATRDQLPELLPMLANVATQQLFKPWEVTACMPRVSRDIASASAQACLMDDLHRAGFRGSDLGAPLLAPAYALGSLGSAQLAAHLSQTLLSGRVSVLGTGVDHGELVQFAEQLQLPAGAGAAPAAQFGGGEVRTEVGGRLALVAVAGPAAGAADRSAAAAQAVLKAVLGNGAVTKYGGARGLLGAAAAAEDASAVALSAIYPDCGLIGYMVAAEADQAGRAVAAVHKAFKSASLTEADLARGRAIVRAELLSCEENSAAALEAMAAQSAAGGAISVQDALKAVDAVKLADLQKAHKALVGGKLCMAARGSLQTVPYLDQL